MNTTTGKEQRYDSVQVEYDFMCDECETEFIRNTNAAVKCPTCGMFVDPYTPDVSR